MTIPKHWSATIVGRFCTYYKGGTPFEKLVYSNAGVPVLAKGDIKPFGRLVHSGTRFVEPALAREQGFYTTRPGDFLMTTRDLTQAADVLGLMAPAPEGFLVNQGANIVRFDREVDWRFLVYWTNGPIYRAHMKANAVGSTQIHIRKEAFIEAPLWLPPLSEQRAIAHILGTLDDKIELNRRMNETLEEMARALFKSWFVDFDPVHAKAAGKKPYGMDDATAAHFPDTFENSELGPIPKGWRSGRLAAWATVSSGGTPSKEQPGYWNGSIPWISPKAMTSIHVDDSEQRVSEAAVGNGTRIAPAGATLIMVRGMGLHQEVRVSQARRDVTFNQDVKALVSRNLEPSLLLYSLLNAQQDLLSRVESSGHGTGKLPSDVLLSHSIVAPVGPPQRELSRHMDVLNERMALARREVRTLASIRDTLLPKLLTGQISPVRAERAAEVVP